MLYFVRFGSKADLDLQHRLVRFVPNSVICARRHVIRLSASCRDLEYAETFTAAA
jgi:hypothetical protein